MRVLILLCFAWTCQAAVRLSSVLTSSEQENIKNMFQETPYPDVARAYYAVLGLKSLSQGGAVPNDVKKSACDAAKSVGDKNLEELFYATSIMSSLGSSCKHEFPAAVIDSASKKIVDGSDAQTLYHAVSVLSNTGKKFSSVDVVTHLTKAVTDDDSVLSSSFGVLTVTLLDPKTDVKALLEKSLDIEDMGAQADEVDERYLHFENDLRTTATFLRAAFTLAKSTKKPVGIAEDRVILFLNFILKSKNPLTSEAGYNVVSALNSAISYANTKFAKVQLLSGNTVSQEKGTVKFSVTDVLNHPIEGLTVKADSVMRKSDEEVILSNVPLKKSAAASGTTYELNLWDLKPKSGFYSVTLNVVPTGGTKLVGTTDAEFKIKVTTLVEIVDAQIGTMERESTTADWKKVKHPQKATDMKADAQQKVVMSFKVKDTLDGDFTLPHQVFVLFQHVESGREVIFIAEPDKTKLYQFEVDLHSASSDQFAAGGEGKYTIHLIVGDASISNPILWHVADINLSFAGAAPAAEKESIYTKKKEIHHKFRESEKRPPAAVSTIFTFACLAPLLILVISWLRTGLNLRNLSFAPKNLVFHIGLTGIFVLYYFFWVKLDMFTTVRYLLPLGAITFLAGNKVLSQQSVQ